MNITEAKVIPTSSVNSMIQATANGKPVLLIGLKEAYREKTQYQKALKRQFEKYHEMDSPYLMKMTALEDIENYGTCIVLEREPGRTLDKYLQETHSDDEKKAIILQIAEGLNYLHHNGVVHGMLYPGLVYITTQGDQVRIINFREHFTDALMESSNVARYIAPEAEDGTVALDARADIYALGQIMKDMRLPMEYSGIIQRSTGFGRSERYLDIDAFLADFDHRHSSSGSTSPKKAALLSLVVLLLVGVCVAIWLMKSNTDSNETSQAQTEQTAADSTNEGSTSTDANDATTSTEAANTQSAAANGSAETNGSAAGQYTGDLAFLNDLVPQMHKDLDKIFAPLAQSDLTPQAKADVMKAVNKKLKTYYKGLRRSLGPLSDAKSAAFDKEFSSYVNQKKQQY
ncbi:MAG: protein kinase domain-containing protein [Prevotella sp.]|jgi:serine/threonine protein kinase